MLGDYTGEPIVKSLRITPGHKPHSQLMDDMEAFMVSRGNIEILPSLTYHEFYPPDIQEKLRFCNHPSAHYIRTRADRLAIYNAESGPFLFEYDAKTDAGRYQSWAIELLPVAYHILLRHHIDCLFGYRGPAGDRGFWASDPPEAAVIFIPKRNEEYLDHYHNVAACAFPGVAVKLLRTTSGSGDPFVKFGDMTVAALPSWKSLVVQMDAQRREETS